MRIAIVNDMRMATECLRQVLISSPGYEVAWVAKNGAEAVASCLRDRPDLILMDMVMPVMSGAEATRQIMAQCPCPVLVVTSSLDTNAALVFETLGAGALDAVKTPVLSSGHGTADVDEFLRKVDMLHRLSSGSVECVQSDIAETPARAYTSGNPMVAIGASSGGPSALEIVISGLPADFAAPVVIIQHIDPTFSHELVQWLDRNCALKVQLAVAGERPRVAEVFIADGQGHLAIGDSGVFQYQTVTDGHAYRPSVDVFFDSLASNWHGDVTAVMLTGMGRDGANGMLALRRAGHTTLVQDEASCTVFGMPKAAIEVGAALDVLPLECIAPALVAQLGHTSVRKAI